MIDKQTNVFASSAFWMVSKQLAKLTSIDAAILMADLAAKQQYFTTRNLLTTDGYFFNTSDNIEQDTNIKRDAQKKYIDQLESLSLVECSLRGIPRRKFFRVNLKEYAKHISAGKLPADFNYTEYLQSNKWKKIARKIRAKYNYKCAECNSTIDLNVHHLTYEHIGNEQKHLDDLVLLCNKCHKTAHGIGDINE